MVLRSKAIARLFAQEVFDLVLSPAFPNLFPLSSSQIQLKGSGERCKPPSSGVGLAASAF